MVNWTEEEYEQFRSRGTNHPLPKTLLKQQTPKPSRMNKLEARYGEHLGLQKTAGEIEAFLFEPIKLRLAKATFYTPDYLVVVDMFPDDIQPRDVSFLEFHEVKGFWRDDARVKIKVAAEQFPWFRFRAVTYKNGQWEYEDFS